MIFLWQKYVNTLFVLAVGVFLYISIFGLNTMGMNMGLDEMINCPLMPGHSEVICKMNPVDHIREWQNMFTALPSKEILSVAFLLLFFILRKLKVWSKFSVPISTSYSNIRLLFLENFSIFVPLKEAFSQGILNPKVF